jgi:multicomponent Na+:H+ antiporter subunit E
MLLLNLLLAIIWVALTGHYEASNYALGFVLAFLVLRLTQYSDSAVKYVSRVRRLFFFIGFFLRELVISSLRVVLLVLSLHPKMKPAVVAIPLDVTSDDRHHFVGESNHLDPGHVNPGCFY